ncbi:similar to Saccharomyces cerevisiae YPL076W GPI2 Protein involved in the synthesis of N-acetylglucosaminyl phosphatidylinositol (GlcNAc-PI) [Maudiozyma saulgeensis]|uniref:Similar to Saccharomyces cerevisiae YPL076W GPI2 Protein involved in the synthesis of N-acetylglucosaminyl phosphatidylinositol (GlcNAc-PI) n=1 Tax=Maudiozyma saulgeensis TaxID=1789683 RepID=A0A1X7R6I3_9SACH|nr:similar to Saccharomyces cerevisiae YPL076W GPI2 Protein involved in the synthesis of N-acetylglucosaminyl phosphatidylinositol (GlcNAc-PI) [Kazachstania saulgeensis]
MSSEEPWSRLLWIKQKYPDNYTDPDFIRFMEKMKQKREGPPIIDYDFDQIRKDSLKFYNIFLNSSFIYIVFTLIYYYKTDARYLAGSITLITMLVSTHKNKELTSLLNIKSSFIIIFTLLTLSPVLRSLSMTTASDSIWTVSFWINILYILTCATSSLSPSPHKEDIIKHEASIFYDIKDHSNNKPSNLATNLLLANVAMLASRLNTTTDVFCFLLIAIQVNIILPRIINISHVKVASTSSMIVYLFVGITIGYRITLIFLISSVSYIIFMPKLFHYWQVHYRRRDYEILDLWDPRTPVVDVE